MRAVRDGREDGRGRPRSRGALDEDPPAGVQIIFKMIRHLIFKMTGERRGRLRGPVLEKICYRRITKLTNLETHPPAMGL